MNTVLNRAAGGAARLALLGLCAWTLSGCSDHGPVNLFAPELFNHHIGGPNLVFYSASQTAWPPNLTTSQPSGTSTAMQIIVNIANTGGAGTYEPLSVTFTSSDCHVVWDYDAPGSGLYSNANAWDQPANSGQNYALAVSPQGAGTEVPASSQSFVQLYQGYYNGSSPVVANSGISAAFYYAPNGSCSACTPTINMAITDGLGNVYNTSFTITVTQSGAGGNGVNDCPF